MLREKLNENLVEIFCRWSKKSLENSQKILFGRGILGNIPYAVIGVIIRKKKIKGVFTEIFNLHLTL